MDAIVVEGISKMYQEKMAVKDISFALKKGEIFGFLGPNGSGKTTTVKILNGMLSPTEGSCRVFGIDPSVDPVQIHRIAGVVTEHAQMYGNMTGLENLVFYGSAFGMNVLDSKKRALHLLRKLDLTNAKDRKLDTYSTGMRQRLSLARAMMHQPKILFLDEPTSGLDPESAQSVNQIIKSLAMDEDCTIFLCTHQLQYAHEICTSYGLINEGRMLAVGSLKELRTKIFSGLTVSIKSDYIPMKASIVKTGLLNYEIKVQSEAEIPAIIKEIVEAGGNIYNVSNRELSLEEIYFSLLEGKGGNIK